MYNPFSLEGKTILVTGASSGIGRTTAVECSKAGASLIISGRNTERLETVFEELVPTGRHISVAADISAYDGIDKLVAAIDSIDGIVHCAGISCIAPVQFSNAEKFRSVFDVNFFSWTQICRLLYKKKAIKRGGSLVSISSISSASLIAYGHAIYGTSKAAMTSWNKYCALEFASKSIRVNTISPGVVETPLINDTEISEEQFRENMKEYPLKRYGRPEDVAYASIYLLSDASQWVTGTNLVVDGGITLK